MSPNECATWIQSGLALTPFAGCQVGSSLDWTLAWSVIGEWTSRALESSFHLLPVTGRETATLRSYLEIMTVDCLLYSHGHEHALNRDHYLPCCTCLDRQNCSYVLVIECTKPRDPARIWRCQTRHSRDLPAIAREGWLPLASAMVGKDTQLAQWVGSDLRPDLPGPPHGTRRTAPPLSVEDSLSISGLRLPQLKTLAFQGYTWSSD